MKRTAFFCFMLCSLLLHAQQDTAFGYAYGSYGDEVGRAIALMPDSGYILAGSTGSFGNGASDVYILRIDSLGKVIWSKVYGGPNVDRAEAIDCHADGTCVLAGFTNSFGNGSYNVYVLKINLNGDTLWTATYGGSEWDMAYKIKRTQDGGYIICGETYSNSAGENDMLLLKISQNGEWEWEKRYGGALRDVARDVVQLPDGGFALTGYTESTGYGKYDIALIRTDSWGDTLFTRSYGGVKDDYGFGLHFNPADQTLLIAGSTENFGAVNLDFFALRTNLTGDTIWTNRVNGPDFDDEWFAVSMNNTGEYIFTGYSYSIIGAGYEDVFFMKLTSNNQITHLTTFGWLEYERGYGILQTPYDGYAFVATTNSFGSGNKDVFFIKTKANGFYSYQVNPASEYHDTNHIHLNIPTHATPFSLSVFPVPANDWLHLQWQGEHIPDSKLRIQLYNTQGSIVQTTESASFSQLNIPLAQLSPGLYFLQGTLLNSHSEEPLHRFTTKIIISR